MELTTKQKIVTGGAVILASFAVGRYTVPEHIKIETKTVEVIKEVKVEDKTRAKKKDKKYTRTVTIHPDGSSISVSEIVENSSDIIKDDKKTNTETNIAKDETKEVTRGGSRFNISALAGANPLRPTDGLDYGLSVTKDLIGPITIGAWGLSNGIGGLSLGVSF